MSLRSLGSLLTRRLLAPGSAISPAQAKKALASPAAGMPARPLHSPRDFAVGGVGVAAAAFAGFLSFMKGADDESAGEVTTKEVTGDGEEAKKPLAAKQGAITEAATEEHNGDDDDDDFSLEEYLAEMTKMAAAQKKARHDERSCKKAAKEATNSEAVKDDDEAAMKARFEEWIREYGKRYRSEEEKARRYELFKAFADMVDKATAQGGAVFVTNHTADWTEEECRCLYDSDVDWDDYLDHIRSLIDKKNAKARKASRD